MATFREITDRLVRILTDERATLMDGLDPELCEIRAQLPNPLFNRYAMFVHMSAQDDIQYGSMTGTGTAWVGEIDGVGTWRLTCAVNVPMDDEEAAADCERMADNLLTVLPGYRQEETDPVWGAMLVSRIGGIDTYQTETTGQVVNGIGIDLRIRWSREQT